MDLGGNPWSLAFRGQNFNPGQRKVYEVKAVVGACFQGSMMVGIKVRDLLSCPGIADYLEASGNSVTWGGCHAHWSLHLATRSSSIEVCPGYGREYV